MLQRSLPSAILRVLRGLTDTSAAAENTALRPHVLTVALGIGTTPRVVAQNETRASCTANTTFSPCYHLTR